MIMGSEYIQSDESVAHEVAMQFLDENKLQQDINIKWQFMNFNQAIVQEELYDEQKSKGDEEEKLTAMQKDVERLPRLSQVYHEAPDDVFELIVSKCSDVDEHGWGRGGLNALRLANNRCKKVAESCTTKLTNLQREDGPFSLPVSMIERCVRVEEIRCDSYNLRSLEGCPDGMTRLLIGDAPHLSDLSPLSSCSRLESLDIEDSSVTDISVVSLMPRLKELVCCKAVEGRPSIKDLSPLTACPNLRKLWVRGNEVKELSFLSSFTALEDLGVTDCPLITSLAPLSNLKGLQRLRCRGIHPRTSLLPLASCTGLVELRCQYEAVDLEELRRRRPELKIVVF